MANEVATQDQSRSGKLVAYFESNRDKFVALMPEKDVDRFMRVVSNAVLRDPSIAEASTKSIFLECQKAAADGLVLDGREAVLTKFASRKKDANGNWVDGEVNVAYIPMIRGLKKLVSQAPQVSSWTTGLVYEAEINDRERFDYTAQPPMLLHRPIIVGNKGEVVAAYSVVRLKSGEMLIDVMSRGKLDAIKNRTKSKKRDGTITGPWSTDVEEMYLKTVARHHFKSLPLTEKIESAMNRVDELYDLGGEVLDVDPEPEKETPRSVANKRSTSAASKLAAAKPKPGPDKQNDPKGGADEQVVEHDPETGEVDEEEEDSRAFDPDDAF